ncbi:hypothetical protein [uncultured Chryseobacterium sp.]|uniref:hypothetical protein n=1 Tax=uncultured Chryseobacterium sp. TaxID=259322 RepID=UPI0025EAC3BB|nr:hypothetical protein [uncultured Chryseobacterium sp.]
MFLTDGSSPVKKWLFIWNVYMEEGYKTNIFGMINRSNVCHWKMSEQNINSEFVVNFLEDLSFKYRKRR